MMTYSTRSKILFLIILLQLIALTSCNWGIDQPKQDDSWRYIGILEFHNKGESRVFDYKLLENGVEKNILFDKEWAPSKNFDYSYSKKVYSTFFEDKNNFRYGLTINDMNVYRIDGGDSTYCTDYIRLDRLRTFCVFMIGREYFEEI